MKWYQNPVFEGRPEDLDMQISKIATPAFRMSLQSSIYHAHPLDYVEEYSALFELFEPILQRDATRLLFIEPPRLNKRRRKKILPEDWEPFRYQREIISDDDRTFIGFDFQSGDNNNPHNRRYDIGPTKFYARVDSNIRLDASIPVEDFLTGALDIDRLKACLFDLPIHSGLAGYGMCISDTLDWPVYTHGLIEPARRFPVLDLCASIDRSWVLDSGYGERDYRDGRHMWLGGLNWLTHVGEPFLSRLGGLKAVTDGLDSRIIWDTGKDAVVFQIGERPITGQAGIDDDLLPLYFELGQRLQPPDDGCPSTRYPFHRVFGGNPTEYPENVHWARRFYDGPDGPWFREYAEKA